MTLSLTPWPKNRGGSLLKWAGREKLHPGTAISSHSSLTVYIPKETAFIA
jgi:hypothetical protein